MCMCSIFLVNNDCHNLMQEHLQLNFRCYIFVICDTQNIAIKVPNGYTTNQAVQPRKMARSAISNVERRGFNYLSRQKHTTSEYCVPDNTLNSGAFADLSLCFRICKIHIFMTLLVYPLMAT